MILQNLIFCSLYILSSLVYGRSAENDQRSSDENNDWPINNGVPFPYETPSPMSFYSSRAKPMNSLSPVITRVSLTEPAQFCNDGTSITATPSVPESSIEVTGGPLGDEVYRYIKLIYHWSNDPGQGIGGSIDQKSTPVYIAIISRNIRYKSLEEALNYPNGTAIILPRIDVQGNIPNPDFEGLVKLLEQVKTAGSCVTSNASNIAPPDAIGGNSSYYYAYPGSNYVLLDNENQDMQSYSATIITFPLMPTMSIDQYSAFQKLRNKYDSPVDKAFVSSYPQDQRPLIQAPGVRLESLP